jgi:hypothetical protein
MSAPAGWLPEVSSFWLNSANLAAASSAAAPDSIWSSVSSLSV